MITANDVFPAFAFVGFAMVLIPFPWHLQAWNTGTCLYMFWTGIGCLNLFINSIIWKGNAINWAPVWCDISSRVYVAINVGIPTASLCINRRLYKIASVTTSTVPRRERRRAIAVDLAIGLGVPVLHLVSQYIVQGHRFDIFEDIGCFPFTYNTVLAFPLVYMWPLIIGVISAVYCCLTIRAFLRRRALFKELLSANNNLTPNRYFRLMGLAAIELLGTIPFSCWGIYLNSAGVRPWKGWKETHIYFSRVRQVPSIMWHQNRLFADGLEMTRWTIVVCAFIFFGFFGFAEEARRHYRLAFYSVAKRVGFSTGTMGSSGPVSSSSGAKPYPNMSSFGNFASRPSFVQQESGTKRESVLTTTSSMSKSFQKQGSQPDFPERLSQRISIGSVFHELKLKDAETESTAESQSSTISHDDEYIPSSPKSNSPSGEPASPFPEIARPEPVLDLSSPPRHNADAPIPAEPPRTDDIV